MKIGESRENYLEMILMLQNKGIKVRSTDVAKALDFSKPSVSRAVGILKEDGYIEVQDDGELTFTKDGESQINFIVETKDMKDEKSLRSEEDLRIRSAEKFFETMKEDGVNVVFKKQLKNDDIVSMISSIVKEN